ncbi:MAG: malectin domain-containing carbohydrate-binding protein [Microscillaceae bacterium]|nr:malectin domain-containing carbohydrate-binding protein [Microscillaceae bacterium]
MTTVSRNLNLAKLLLSDLVHKSSGYPFLVLILSITLLWKGFSLFGPLSSSNQDQSLTAMNTQMGLFKDLNHNERFSPLSVSKQALVNEVISFTLINATTDTEITTLSNGAVINVSTIGTRNLTLRANTSAGVIGSVRLVLTGPISNQRTENTAPYALFGDAAGNYEGAIFANGSYTMAATPYSQANLQGTAGTTFQVSFIVTDQTGSTGDTFTLINADNDTEIVTLTTGTTVNLAPIGNPGLNIRFNPGNGQTQSMQFVLTGPTSVTKTENIAPYAIFGDVNGDFTPGSLAPGFYTLIGRSYSAANLGGTQLASTQVTFTIQSQTSQGNLSASPVELIFDAVRFTTSPSQTVTVTNNTGNSVQITDVVSSTSRFTRTSTHTFPLNLANGQSVAINVAFTPGSAVGALNGNLDLRNGANTLFSVPLYGLSINGLEGANEPTLANVVTTLGYNINVGWTTLASNTNPALMGEEVNIQLFERAGGGNVGILPVARYSPKESLPFGYYTKSGNTPIHTQVGVLTSAGNEHQALFPELSSGNTSFNPGTAAFGIYVESNSFGRFNYTEDGLNTGGVAHRVRTYPLKNRQGQTIANSYLVCFEDANNGDYQDYMYVLSNVKAAGSGGSTPTSLVKINAGGAQYTDGGGQVWAADNYFSGGTAGSKSFNVGGTTEDDLYLKYRFGTNFSYNIPVVTTGPVTVNLHFVEPFFGVSGPGGTGIRVFDVNVESGQGVLNNLDLNALVTPGTALVRTFNNINVTGGVLTISFTATKDNAIISAIEIIGSDTGGSGSPKPYVVSVHDGSLNVITEGETGIPTDVNISSTQIILPNGSIDNTTVNNSTVKLTKVSTGLSVSATVNSTGGGDALTLVPAAHLESFTQYRFEVTSGVRDLSGESFIPYTLNFTTGEEVVVQPGNLSGVNFEKVQQPNTNGRQYTSLVIGPDNRMYASTIDGYIERFNIDTNGNLVSRNTISSIRNHTRGSNVVAGNKIVIGMAFDPSSTATNLKLWVTYMNTYAFESAPDWDGNIALLTGSNLQNVQDVVINLPRSLRDHLTNSLAFGPDGALYCNQSGNSAMGRADLSWGNRDERLLSGAILRLNVNNLPANLPIDAKTEEGGNYNPYAAGAALTIYATGLRNAYDLVWHSNGELYVPTNGSAAGGNSPTSDSGDPTYITPHPNAPAYTGGFVPKVTNVTPTQKDWLFRVSAGKYYGHPNPHRREYALGRGDIDIDNSAYNGIQPDPDFDAAGIAFDFEHNKSPNGAIEYKSDIFNGKLKGLLMVVRYSEKDDIIVLQPGSNKNIISSTEGIAIGLSGFSNPLDLIENTNNGYLYVSEYGASKITMLRPVVTSGESSITRFVLVNADTDKDIMQLNNNATINLSTVGTNNLNIRAETNSTSITSVYLSLTGAKTTDRTESSAPYTLFGDADATGDYFGEAFGNGNYTITATPYTSGTIKGQSLTISFTITGSTARSSVTSNTTQLQNNDTPTQVTRIYPIPLNQNKLNIDLNKSLEGEVGYSIFNKQGQKITEGTLKLDQPDNHLELQLQGILKENEIYYLRISGVDEVFKIINK